MKLQIPAINSRLIMMSLLKSFINNDPVKNLVIFRQLCCWITNFVALIHGCYYTGIFIAYNILNNKLIVSCLEMVCNVKTFIDVNKAYGVKSKGRLSSLPSA
jgi:hypothetical protein